MAFKRPTQTLSPEALKKAQAQIAKQEIGTAQPRTSDPKFPMYSIPPGEKVMMYVPNHQMEDADGNLVLRQDMPAFHPIQPGGNSYTRVRCVNGITIEGTDFDGTCPACEMMDTSYAIANTHIERECERLGLSPSDDSEDVRSIRRKVFGQMKVQGSARNRAYTFPIAVFEREQRVVDGRNKNVLVTDEDGNPVYNLYWYTVTERTMEKFEAALASDESEDGDIPPMAGSLFLVTYGSKDEKGNPPSRRDAGRDISIARRAAGQLSEVLPKIDKETEDWTPVKAQEVIYENNLYAPTDLKESLAPLAAEMERELELLKGNVAAAPAASLDALTGGAPSAGLADDRQVAAAPAGAVSAALVDEDEDE